MNFEVKYTDNCGCYVVTTEDGRAALADTQTGQVDWSDTEEHFLRFGPFREVEQALEPHVLAELDDLLEGRVEFVEEDPEETIKYLMEHSEDLFEEEDDG